METLLSTNILGMGVVSVLFKLVVALIIFIIGKSVIGSVVNGITKLPVMEKMEPTARTFITSAIRVGLMLLMVISIIAYLGVPMASVITVLASAGVTVGLALQGALSNLAGGIMLLFFKPFRVGDFVEASGVWGTVKEVTLFYTIIMTTDNRRVTVPNGALMNANVTNYSTEELRRVDIVFSCARTEDPVRVQEIMQDVMRANPKVIVDPKYGPPFARLSGGTNEAMEFTMRAWCRNEDCRDVFYEMNIEVATAFRENGIKAPAVRVIQ